MPGIGSFLLVLIDHMHIHIATDPWAMSWNLLAKNKWHSVTMDTPVILVQNYQSVSIT